MNAKKLMKVIGDANEDYVQSALETRTQKTPRKRLSLGRKLVLAAAIVMALTTTVFAAEIVDIKSLVSGGGDKSYSSFRDMDKAIKQAGFQVDAKETFESGYTFEFMNVSNVDGFDADGNKALTYKNVSIYYAGPAGHTLILRAYPDMEAIPNSDNPVKESRKFGDITAEYMESHYKFLPAEKEGNLTEEEERWQQQPGNFISYYSGVEEAPSESKVTCLSWTKDGICYSIMDLDGTESTEVLFSMAEELIAIP